MVVPAIDAEEPFTGCRGHDPFCFAKRSCPRNLKLPGFEHDYGASLNYYFAAVLKFFLDGIGFCAGVEDYSS